MGTREHHRGLDEGDEKKWEDKRRRRAVNNLQTLDRKKTCNIFMYKLSLCLSILLALLWPLFSFSLVVVQFYAGLNYVVDRY